VRKRAAVHLPSQRQSCCCFLSRPAFVSMVEAADFSNGNDRSEFGWLHRSSFRGVFSQREVRPGLVIIRDKRLHVLVQESFVEHDHVIQTLEAYRADDALDVRSLPWRTRRRKHFLDAHISDLLHEIVAENPVPISQEITRCRVPGKRVPELLSGPFCGRMRRYADVENPAPVVCQHQEHVQDLEPDGWHGEEVDRDQALEMVGKKGPPSLGWRVPTADHVLADTGLADVDAELQKLAVNARSAPQGFSRLILRIRVQTSLVTAGRPRLPLRTFQVQNSWKLFLCQAITVSGWTMTSAVRQSLHSSDSHAQKRRSTAVSLGRFTERCKTPSWWRRARISS
jgi:hypothetical protein